MQIDTTLLKYADILNGMSPEVDNDRLFYPIEVKNSFGNATEVKYVQKWDLKYANWITRHNYDSQNRLQKTWHTDTLNNIMEAVVCGAPITKYAYNEKGLMTEIGYYNEKEAPSSHDCSHYHKMTMGYDESGRINFKQFSSETGDVIHSEGYKLDSKGWVEELYLFDKNKVLKKDSPSVIKIKYNDEGREIENRFFNWNGKPVKGKKKTSKETYEYIPGGRITRYYNSRGDRLKTVQRTGGAAATMEEELDE